MERKKRLALWFLSAGLAVTLLTIGHEAFHESLPVAFLRSTNAADIVRLKGCVPAPGIYRFPEHTKLVAVINMTAPLLAGNFANKAFLETELRNGDIVIVAPRGRQTFEISIDKMKAKERMLLGIPLDPDIMDLDDWDSLPGIGPVLAKSIMEDRHNNGVFGSFDSLQRVPGMGEKKLNELKIYF